MMMMQRCGESLDSTDVVSSSMAGYDCPEKNDESIGAWDTRTNTLTFHTFRPTSPDHLTAVSGVTPQMFNGTFGRRNRLLGAQMANGHQHHQLMEPEVQRSPPSDVDAVDYCYANGIDRQPFADTFSQQPRVLRNYQELLIDIRLLPTETVAGFSMNASIDGGLATTAVFKLMKGSAADRAGLEIKDEILEINGVPVINSNHQDVVRLIHECIKTRTVQLKVRRKLNDVLSSTSSKSPSSTNSDIANSDRLFDSSQKSSSIDEPSDCVKIWRETKLPHVNGNRFIDTARGPRLDVSEAFVVTNEPTSRGALIEDVQRFCPNARTVDMLEAVHSDTPSLPSSGLRRNGDINGIGHYQTNGQHNYGPVVDGLQEEQETSFIVGDISEENLLVKMPISVGQYYGSGNDLNEDPADRLRRYEQDLQKRREVEERQAREQDFLRSSVRGSKKLQALERNGAPGMTNGHVNDAFVRGHGDDSNGQPCLSLDDILTSVNRLADVLDRSPEYQRYSVLLRDLFADPAVRNAVEVTAAAQRQQLNGQRQDPEACDASDTVQMVLEQFSGNDAVKSLQTILAKPEFQAVLYAHDRAAKSYRPADCYTENGANIKETSLDDERNGLRIVTLYKNGDNYLGATVLQDGQAIIVGRIIKGGVAEKSGLLHEGDELLEVNGVDLRQKSVHEVCDILLRMTGELRFVVVPGDEESQTVEESPGVKHMRALFAYQPMDDFYLPCRDLGLKFDKGDILHVVSMADTNWWQAHRDGDDNYQLAGLIPSTSFQIQKEQHRIHNGRNDRDKTKKPNCRSFNAGRVSGFWCAKGKKHKKNTIILGNGAQNPWSTSLNEQTEEEDDEDQVLAYEEVTLYMPRAGKRRPIVLVGPAKVGCLQLRQKLMESEKDKFSGVVPHTSRGRKPDEQDGVHYQFVGRQQFQEGVANRKFVEWGEYQKHFYGTSFEAIQRVIDRGRTCILTLKPESLKALRNSDLMPFVVFISPPGLDRLKINKAREVGIASVKDEELTEIITEAKNMNELYGHYFDKIIVNSDLESSFHELRTTIHRLESEPQWVPAAWIRRLQRNTNNNNHYSNGHDHDR